MNLRTYAVGPDGPGIWFFSLDAARIIAVLGARVSYGLPYYWSDMRVDIDLYVPWSLKRGSGRRCRLDFPSPDFLAHHSPGVDSGIGRPRFVANEARQQEIA